MPEIARIENKNGQKALFVDGKPFIMVAGEIHNSSASSMEFLEPILDKLAKMGLNTVLLPISWQQLEPEEGHFDFSLADSILEACRARNLRIGLLWFGSWKNAQCSYAPEWVKTDTKRFFRAELEMGRPIIYRKTPTISLPSTTLSPFCEEAMRADARAFAALMKHLHEVDKAGTVITVQVENETGFLGSDFDHSEASLRLFEESVPVALIRALKGENSGLEGMNWRKVFGRNAKESFIAYYTAKYVEFVASAGKAEHPLPMVVNCWLNGKGQKTGKYPCGGPVAKVHPIWRAAAPTIDVFCPDIYVDEIYDVMEDFHRDGNALYIPESKPCSWMVGREIYAIGAHQAMCYASFGVEDIGVPVKVDLSRFSWLLGFTVGRKKSKPQDIAEYSKICQLLSGAAEVLASHYGTEDLQALCAEKKNYRKGARVDDVTIRWFPLRKDAACLFCRLNENEFLMLNFGGATMFKAARKGEDLQALSLEEGYYKDGVWRTLRVLNGDEEMMMPFGPTLLKLKFSILK